MMSGQLFRAVGNGVRIGYRRSVNVPSPLGFRGYSAAPLYLTQTPLNFPSPRLSSPLSPPSSQFQRNWNSTQEGGEKGPWTPKAAQAETEAVETESIETEPVGEDMPNFTRDTVDPAGPEIPNFTRATVDEMNTIEEHEKIVGDQEQFGFQAETKKLLDIVARSLYTDKEVFVRELISNASDALEKVRHSKLTEGYKEADGKKYEMEILMSTDEVANSFTIQDFGIGMSKEELKTNLGTIAHSGSQKFVNGLGETEDKKAKDIIGQFGVGFYAAFMVADKVKVYSRRIDPGSKGYLWESDGLGNFTITEAEGVDQGTKIIVMLKRSESAFSKKMGIENIIKKYSNFVNFPIRLNGETVNTVKALWGSPKGSISDDQHKEFYQFIARAYDEPRYTFHYTTDSPLHIQSLFYVPDQHNEKYGMGRMEPGVALYCRRVLIQSKCQGLLPDWLRFVKGVVDSEDIPLNLSREHLQDSALIARLSNVLVRRFLKFLNEEAAHDQEKYKAFYEEYSNFLKEGVITDQTYKEDIAKLLRVESSNQEPGTLVSFDEYVDRMPESQKSIYFLCAPSRVIAENSPYFEAFQKRGIEVTFFFSPIDEVMLSSLPSYKGKRFESIESINDLPEHKSETEANLKKDETVVRDLNKWVKEILEDKVSIVRESNRVSKSPAIVIDQESVHMRRIMSRMDPVNAPKLPRQVFEYNIAHPVMRKINQIRFTNEEFASEALEQVFDNALIAAGLLTDPRVMLGRLNNVLEKALDGADPSNGSEEKEPVVGMPKIDF